MYNFFDYVLGGDDWVVVLLRVFDHGMKCFDEYTARCFSKRNLSIFRDSVLGARRFFFKFCSDPEFQEDYLQHKDCFSYIQQDWVRCTKDFQTILTNELKKKNNSEKFLEFCCARYAYENCIYNSARFKCYQNSATFARDTARMLSDEKYFSNCRQYEDVACNRAYMPLRKNYWRKMLPLLLLLLLLRRLITMMFGHQPN